MIPIKPWTMHYMDVWQERAGNPSLPCWVRVVSLAYGGMERNGHCPLAPGDIEFTLSVVDKVTGTLTPADPSNVNRAIRFAVEQGFLGEGSNRRCLVVPRYVAEGGVRGHEHASCTRHSRAPGHT